MHPRQRADPSFPGLCVSLDVVAPRQSNDRFCQPRGILSAGGDFTGRRALPFFGPLPFSDIDGYAADAYHTAGLVDGRGRRADAPAGFAVRAADAKLRLI